MSSPALDALKKDFATRGAAPVYNHAELRATLDDALRRLLVDVHGFQEVHRHSNVKLALGFTASAIAMGVSLYNYFRPFEECRELLVGGCLSYIVLNAILAWYVYYVEAGVLFVGKKGASTLAVHATMHAHSPIYRIDMTVCTQGKAVPASGHCERSVGAYFDEDGMFAGADAFIADVDRVLGGCGSVGGRGKRE